MVLELLQNYGKIYTNDHDVNKKGKTCVYVSSRGEQDNYPFDFVFHV